MSVEEYKIYEAPTLSREGEMRYIVVDTKTNDIVDDAQGYGYKSPQKAWAAFQWKLRNGHINNEADATVKVSSSESKTTIYRWLEKHPEFVDTLNMVALDIGKGRGPDDRITPRIVQNLLNEMNLTVDFAAKDILKIWRNYDG